MTSFKSFSDSGSFDDELPLFGLELDELGFFDDELTLVIFGGPTIPAALDDIDGATEIDASYAIDGMAWFMLDFVNGASDVEMAYVGPIYAALDPVDGASVVHVTIRARLFAYLDPVDGSTDFSVVLNPNDPSQGTLGVAGQRLNTPVGVAVSLTGALAIIPPLAIT